GPDGSEDLRARWCRSSTAATGWCPPDHHPSPSGPSRSRHRRIEGQIEDVGCALVASREDEWLWGWGPAPGIASVWAEYHGRRTADGLVREDGRFRPWMVIAHLDDVAHLGRGLARAGDRDAARAAITYRELGGPGALRFLLRAADVRTLTAAVVAGASRRLG